MNKQLFGNKLPNCFLNFSRDSNRVIGFFAPKRWLKTKTFTHEISLNPRAMGDLKPIIAVSSIVHEMCHLWQFEFGTRSRTGYHNKEWAKKMESIGLMPSNTGKPGGSKTGQQMNDYVIHNGPFRQAFKNMPTTFLFPWECIESIVKKSIISDKDQDKKPVKRVLASIVKDPESIGIVKYNKNKVKYSCPKCKSNVWGKPDLNIVCGDCDKKYKVNKEN
jgi:predicted SprT family Zn-dependent metalloprotease